jgi:hypothetical protein
VADPPDIEDPDYCTRCGERIREPVPTKLIVISPVAQYRWGEADLCQVCSARLWRWLDEVLRPDAEPDFLIEDVGPDVLVHPRNDQARRWVADHIRTDSGLYLYGGIAVPDGARSTRRSVEAVAGLIASDGLKSSGIDDGPSY